MREFKRALGRLCRDRRSVAALCILGAEVLCVLLLPPLLGLEPNLTDRAAGFWAPPSAEHWLGTDDVGRDVFARLLYGGRVSLLSVWRWGCLWGSWRATAEGNASSGSCAAPMCSNPFPALY